MKKLLIPSGAAVCLALFITGCASEELTARVKQRWDTYATLPAWQKKDIDKGVIEVGFTPDMVYMAMGNPSETKADAAGRAVLWTYNNFYPTVDARRMRLTPFSTESTYQSTRIYSGSGAPVGMIRSRSSNYGAGGVQGDTIEPADLKSYTVLVLFEEGKVTRLGIKTG